MPQVSRDVAEPVLPTPPLSEEVYAARIRQLFELGFQTYEKASTYDSVLIAAGFAGFFALWSAVADDLPRSVSLWAVGLMGVALVVYVMFTVAQMAVRAVYQFRLMKVAAEHLASSDFNERWAAEVSKGQRAAAIVLACWPIALAITLLCGLTGGSLVAVVSLGLAMAG